VNILEEAGECDLTAYVDYSALRCVAEKNGLTTTPALTQREFLLRYGIEQRLAQLQRHATPEQAQMLEQGVARLIDAHGMGGMFKVLQMEAVKP
jgi:SAM-dependent MidA family methyltransferase